MSGEFPEETQAIARNANELDGALESIQQRSINLGVSAATFSRAMTKAFSDAVVGGKEFDEVLKSMALRLSGATLQSALKPVSKELANGLKNILNGMFGSGVASPGSNALVPPANPCCCRGETDGGNGSGFPEFDFFNFIRRMLRPPVAFASGGVIGTPTYFPMTGGKLGLAGEAGPEAIMPLSRGADGRLGVSVAGGGSAANVTVHIATPDAASFRRSEAYITGQIARAVARGQRSF